MKRLRAASEKWKNLKPFPFVIITTLLALLITVLIGLVIELAGVELEEIGGPELEKYTLGEAFFLVVFMGPVIETWLGQSLPIRLIQKLVRWKTNTVALIFSTLFFSFCHMMYSVWYFLLILPMGWALAATYLLFQQRKGSAFWMTFWVHAARNAIGVLLSIGEFVD